MSKMTSPTGVSTPTKEENSLKREYETLVKMNKMFEKINDNMDQARINLQVIPKFNCDVF